MRLGQTTEARHAESQAEVLRKIKGVREFAWLPTRLHNGEYLWLGFYWAYFHALRKENGDYELWSSSPDSFAPISDNFAERHGKPVRVSDYFSKDKLFLLIETEPHQGTEP